MLGKISNIQNTISIDIVCRFVKMFKLMLENIMFDSILWLLNFHLKAVLKHNHMKIIREFYFYFTHLSSKMGVWAIMLQFYHNVRALDFGNGQAH